jgi:hypothetical protein
MDAKKHTNVLFFLLFRKYFSAKTSLENLSYLFLRIIKIKRSKVLLFS